jgi:hypothetical protein
MKAPRSHAAILKGLSGLNVTPQTKGILARITHEVECSYFTSCRQLRTLCFDALLLANSALTEPRYRVVAQKRVRKALKQLKALR